MIVRASCVSTHPHSFPLVTIQSAHANIDAPISAPGSPLSTSSLERGSPLPPSAPGPLPQTGAHRCPHLCRHWAKWQVVRVEALLSPLLSRACGLLVTAGRSASAERITFAAAVRQAAELLSYAAHQVGASRARPGAAPTRRHRRVARSGREGPMARLCAEWACGLVRRRLCRGRRWTWRKTFRAVRPRAGPRQRAAAAACAERS
jgi:hypothetical protein